MTDDFRNKFAVVGLGMVTGLQRGISQRTLQVEATRRAMRDAGLKRTDIDGAIGLTMGGGSIDLPTSTDAFPRVLGLPVNFYFTVGRGGAQVSMGIITATKFLELGIAKYVAIACSVNELSHGHESKEKEKGVIGHSHQHKEGYWGAPFGDVRAVSHHSLLASRHMHEYGTTSRQFGAVAVSIRKWAQMNPEAKMCGRIMTIEDHQNSPVLVHPYHLFDICQASDGAVAFILTTADRAKDCARPPVYVAGIGFGEAMEKLWWEKKNYTQLAVEPARKQAFRQAGVQLKDLDFAMLYDCFTAEVIFQLEDYGWCKKGEGGPFAEAGHIAPGGDIPVNTNGGLLSAYHYEDATGFSEAVTQLRGDAGERQVKGARTCLVTSHGGEILSPGMCSIHVATILRR